MSALVPGCPYTPEQVARVCHEANRAIQDLHGDESPSAPWDCETEDIRASAVHGVRRAMEGATPEEMHEEWCRFKAAEHWKYGPVKDPGARTHPALVPYADLPECQRVKDRVLIAVTGAMNGEDEEDAPAYWQARAALSIAVNALQHVALGSDGRLAGMAREALAEADAALRDGEVPELEDAASLAAADSPEWPDRGAAEIAL